MDDSQIPVLAARFVRGLHGVSVLRGEPVPVHVTGLVEHLDPPGVRLYFGPDELRLYMLVRNSDDAAWARETWPLVESGEIDGITVPLPPLSGIFIEGIHEASEASMR